VLSNLDCELKKTFTNIDGIQLCWKMADAKIPVGKVFEVEKYSPIFERRKNLKTGCNDLFYSEFTV